MPRCCNPITGEFSPSYASMLVAPDLKGAVSSIEEAPLQASITAWCSACKGPYFLTGTMGMFPSPSAHHAHMIVLSRRLRH